MMKGSNRRFVTAFLAGALFFGAASPCSAATVISGAHAYSQGGGQTGHWMRDDRGWWYQYAREGYPAACWEKIDDTWYHFNEEGYMETGWITDGGVLYYLNSETGAMLFDCEAVIDGLTYTFNGSGAASGDAVHMKRPVVIPPEEEKSEREHLLDVMCDDILAGLINDDMTDRQKATAIYSWIRGSFRYSGHSATRDWVEEAYQGLRRHHGDCYTYFAVSQALLTRAGLPSIEVIRYTDNDHYWNLTMVDGSWYHFDTTPRSWGGTFCLLTDAQMLAFSNAHGGCFAFDRSLYPATP